MKIPATREMAKQSSIGIDWSNRSYQNERGFKNENMYTTVAYRLPGSASIEELGMSEEMKSDEVSSSVNWVAFKQQFFSSVFIAPNNVSYAKMAFDTAKPGSGYIKDFSAEMSVPYDEQVEDYDFSFYFGPNKYAVLKPGVKVKCLKVSGSWMKISGGWICCREGSDIYVK